MPAAYREEPQLGPETEGFLAAVVGSVPPAAEALEAARAVDPAAAEILEPLLTTTLAPTVISASTSATSSPASATSRSTAGSGPASRRMTSTACSGSGSAPATTSSCGAAPQGGTRSPMDTPLWAAIEEFVERAEPGAAAVPICVAGFTDSHWLRQAFGTVAYGFFPMREMEAELANRLVHSADERIEEADLELGVEFLRHAALAIGR